MKIIFGMNTCFAVKRWVEASEWLRIISEELGLSDCQFSLDILDPFTEEIAKSRIINDIINNAEKYNITIHSAFTGLAAYSYNLLLHPDFGMRMNFLYWYQQAIEIASSLGCRGVGGHVGAFTMNDYHNDERREYLTKTMVDSLSFLSSMAKMEDLDYFLVEPMPLSREPPYTIEGAKEFYNLINDQIEIGVPIKYCIDLGHSCAVACKSKYSRDPYNWLKEIAPLSPEIHLQQTDGKADCHWPFTKEYNERGIIEPTKVLSAIDDSDAQEISLFLEIIHPFEADEKMVLKDLIESVEYWKQYL
ncbi:MAG: TIM barrel protein [Candidatus Lokiarchaeota archaeon]|nr:TIM barrel protein [Candidatus Lokiarchaeota archaeon]